jgi:hypothetical protein
MRELRMREKAAPVSRPNSGASSGPPEVSAEIDSGPTAALRPYSDTVWYARLLQRRMSSTAPVDTWRDSMAGSSLIRQALCLCCRGHVLAVAQ